MLNQVYAFLGPQLEGHNRLSINRCPRSPLTVHVGWLFFPRWLVGLNFNSFFLIFFLTHSEKTTVSPYPFPSIDAYIDGECLSRIFKRQRECKSYVLVLRLVSEEGLSKMDEQAKKHTTFFMGRVIYSILELNARCMHA